jgi:Protein of unknown function (DUF2612)
MNKPHQLMPVEKQPIEVEPPDYYLGLVTSQYQLAPRMMTWLASILQYLVDASNCAQTFTVNFDINTAVGVQLDLLGAIMNTPRLVPFQPSKGVSPILDDVTYRILLLATIAKSVWDGRVQSIYPVWGQLFPGGKIIVVDNQDMSLTVLMSGTFTSITQDLIVNGLILPRPEGVLINYSFANLPVFGFDLNDPNFISGFDTGFWS